MATKEPQTLEELDAEIMRNSNERDELQARSLELHRRRDALFSGERADTMLDGLSDADKAALRERLGGQD